MLANTGAEKYQQFNDQFSFCKRKTGWSQKIAKNMNTSDSMDFQDALLKTPYQVKQLNMILDEIFYLHNQANIYAIEDDDGVFNPQ